MLRKRRHLDDEDLDSGDDEGRADRLQDGEEDAPRYTQKEINIVECDLPRTAKPQPSDGEVRVPSPAANARRTDSSLALSTETTQFPRNRSKSLHSCQLQASYYRSSLQ